MAEAAPVGPEPSDHSLRAALRRIDGLDWLMLLLALLSVGLLAWETWGAVSDSQRRWIIRGDYLICAVFLAEFLWRWRRAGWSRSHLLRHWYDVLGMIPVAQPALRGFRLFRVVRIAILLARFGMAADRALGAEFTYRLVYRFSDEIVDAIGGTITVAVLDEVAEVLAKGTYTRNVARALDENHRELRLLITDKLRADPRTGRLSRLPFYEDIVASVVDASLGVAGQILRDPRTDALVADILRENITQLREAVRRNQAP
ncbi:MAG: ion transporter [Nevskia sp.]|nr:ion transporter [Nevskia sp.]